jgi:hypothetical protein
MGEIRFLGEIENSTTATAKLVRKLAGKYERLTFCYEAGPTGYETLIRKSKLQNRRHHRGRSLSLPASFGLSLARQLRLELQPNKMGLPTG